MDDRKRELLQIYSLHAELAGRVSSRRDGANRLCICVLVSLGLFAVVLLVLNAVAFGLWEARMAFRVLRKVDDMLLFIGFLGTILTVSWGIVIQSLRHADAAKRNILQELEGHLAYAFLTKEQFENGQGVRKYWKLSVVETSLQCISVLLFLGLAISVVV